MQIDMDIKNFKSVNVFAENQTISDGNGLKVVKDPKIIEDDEATYAKLMGSNFHNGTIEVKVLSKLLADAPDHVAFRIDEEDSGFECMYIRPTNGRANNQLRRNRSVQYFSYPDFKFFHSRETHPGEYETYADMGLDEWIDMKIVVKDEQAKLYLNHTKEPVLIVNDLKHGADKKGAVGLFVDIGTEGYFKDLTI